MTITGVFNNLLDKVGLYPPPWAVEELGRCLREPTKEGDLRKLLGKYPDAARWQTIDMTPLARALWHNNYPAAKALVDADPAILGRTWKLDDATPLRCAVAGQNADRLKALARLGADFKEINNDGDTLLHYAAQVSTNPAFVDLLVQLGADPKAKNRDGDTPMTIAAKSGLLVNAFYMHDSDLAQLDKSGKTLVMLAAEGAAPDTAIAALAGLGADLDAKYGMQGNTALAMALQAQNLKAVTALLEAGATLDASGIQGNLSQMLAHNSKDEKLAALLRESDEQRAARKQACAEKMRAHREKIQQEEVASCTEGLDAKLKVRPIRLKTGVRPS